MGAIGNNGEFLRGKMKDAGEAVQETSEITSAFALKNVTLGATIEKLGKEFNRMVTSPGVINFLKSAVEGTLEMIKSLRQLPEWIERNRTMIILLAGAIGIYTRAKIAKMVVDAKDYIVLTAMYAQDKAILIITGLKTVATRAYSTAVQLMTGQITIATIATRIFNGVAMSAAGIVGIVITVLTTAAAIWSAFSTKVKESTKSLIDWGGMMNEAAQNAGKEIGQLQQLYAAVNNVNLKQEDRRAAYAKMQEMYPSLLQNMSYEEAIAGGLAKKYQELQKAIMGKYIIQASEGAISKLGQELFEVESALNGINESLEGSANLQGALAKIGKDGFTNKETVEFQKGFKKSLDGKKKAIEDGFKSLSDFQQKIKENYGVADAIKGATDGGGTGERKDDTELAKLKDKQIAREKALEDHLKRIKDKIVNLRFELEQNEKTADEQERARIFKKYEELLAEATGFHAQTLELEELKQKELEQFATRAGKKWLRINVDFHKENLAASKEAITNIRKHAENSLALVERLRKKLIDDMQTSYDNAVKKSTRQTRSPEAWRIRWALNAIEHL
ncbi:MAG: hypothetical protein IPK62_15535 [Bacteroidetes bacterium]|nr:hypothetical protein [Bacteroidota bacterium]